jgi:hypothetical protein
MVNKESVHEKNLNLVDNWNGKEVDRKTNKETRSKVTMKKGRNKKKR